MSPDNRGLTVLVRIGKLTSIFKIRQVQRLFIMSYNEVAILLTSFT